MTDKKYTRAEFEAELQEHRKHSFSMRSKTEEPTELADAAHNRLVKWFDEVQLDLGHVGALYENLKRVTGEKVAAEVRAEEAEARIWHLERQLAAKRVEEEKEDG